MLRFEASVHNTRALGTGRALDRFPPSSEAKELRRLGGTLTKWRSEFQAHRTTGDSNGPTRR
ncbi:MAG: hypothetical protein M3203_01415 [Actinomycetota bacterium]|nr:hypothetical protein [Actinomycetota bacterium]